MDSGFKFPQRLRLHASILPNVERMQVETESSHLAQKLRNRFREATAAVFAKTIADDTEVLIKLGRRFVGVKMFGRIAAETQPGDQEFYEVAIKFGLSNLFSAGVFAA